MNYLICQDWNSTSGNHAGMAHLCRMLEKFDVENKAITVRKDWHEVKVIRRFRKYIWNFDLYKLIYFFVALSLMARIKENDRIFLLEFLHKDRNQLITAKILRFFFKQKIRIFGMVHLFPHKLEYWFTDSDYQIWSIPVDNILTLGSSLSTFLIQKGISEKKIITTFHYVDKEYYNSNHSKSSQTKLTVISMGNLYRNYELVKEIADELPDIDFLICSGHDKIENIFAESKNVKLYGYLTEDKFKELMESSDISLNVFNDTIGSNVITTSMAMGLAMIVTDVGSIRDYCDDSNAFFCQNKTDYVKAIIKLGENKEILVSMKKASKAKSCEFSIDKFYESLKKW